MPGVRKDKILYQLYLCSTLHLKAGFIICASSAVLVAANRSFCRHDVARISPGILSSDNSRSLILSRTPSLAAS
jgi:hypothetical protein